MDSWIQIDEAEDVAGSLRHAIRCGASVGTDALEWKWFSLALHSALQGACVCHLATTAAPVGAVTRRNAGEWLAFLHSRDDPDAVPPRTQLMALPDLLKAIRKPNSAGDRSNEKGIPVSDVELEWLGRFHDAVRNQFVHFAPMGWSIEVSGLVPLGTLVARVVADIADVGWAFRHKDSQWLSQLRLDLDRLSAGAIRT